MNDNGRRQTFFYIATSLVVLTATVIALVSLSEAHTGQTVCSYIRQSYPANHKYRVQVKGFIYDHYLHLRQEAHAYRDAAAQDPDTVTAHLDLRLGDLAHAHAAKALKDWRELELPGATDMFVRLGLLIPQGWVGIGYVATAISGVIAGIKFTDTVTTGSIVTAAVVIVLSGLFTLRNNLRSFWHDLAIERGAQIEEQQTRIHDLEVEILKLHEATKDELAHHLDEQRVLRHELKGEVAALKAALQVEQAKTDLSTLMEQLAGQHREAMANITAGLTKQQQIIELLAGRDGHKED